ncbi:MAG: hypothetical protein QG582_700 [Candidatus Thermoplasmatota archaeon]|nr:hypothetical protein [Candidatus Thermoplasmatota archaeon]
MKSLQLAKQLEERAKEAGRNKELAEREHDQLRQFLEVCKENDTDLSDVDRIVAEFNASMNARDYQSALANARKASEEAKSAFVRRIGEVADSAEGLLNLAQIPASDAKGALEMLEKSREQVLRDDYQAAMKSAKSAYGAAERALHEYFSVLLSQAQEVLIQSKEMGEDVSLFEELLRKGKSALEKQEYETGLAHVREALEGAGENIRAQVRTAIHTVDELVAAGEELKADMSKVRSHVDKANEALEALRFKEALAYAKRAETEGENSISSKLQETSREVKEGIRKLKAVGEGVDVPQELLEQSQAALKGKNYIEALRALNAANERIKETQFKSVLDVIAQAKDKFVMAKKIGVDMTKPIMLLNTARDNYRLGKFEDALRYAEQARKEIDEDLGVFYSARDQLVELTKAIKYAEDLGGDSSAVRRTLADVKKSFEAKEYDRTAEVAKQGLGEARKVAYDKVMDTIDSTDKAFKLGKRIGADMTETEGLLQRALASLSKEDLPESLKLAKSGLDAASAAMTGVLSDKIHNMDQFVTGFSGEEDLAEVKESIAEARQRLSEKAFERVSELLKDAQERMESAGEEECERLLQKATAKMESLKKMEGDVADLEILLNRVSQAMSNKVYDEATAKAKEIIASADEMTLKLVQAEFSGIKDTVDEAKAVGIEVESAKVSVKAARERFEVGDLEGARTLLHDTRTALKGKVARFDGIMEKIRRAEELISEAQTSRADVSKETKDLQSAERLFQEGEFDDAERVLDGLTEQAEKKLAMYLAAKFILTSKESIELARANGIDVSEASEMLTQAKELMKAKDYEEALEVAKGCDKKAVEGINQAAQGMVKDLQRLITDAKNVGVDTSGPEVLAEKARSLVKSGDYSEALRCIDSARNDIDQIKNLSSQAALEIKVARGNLKDAETLDMEVTSARAFLDQSIEALTRHQYATALELAKKSSEDSSEVTRNTIWGTLEKFRERLERAASEGTAVGVAERCAAEGVTAFNDRRYQDALKLAMQCESEMDRAELQREVGSKAVEMAKRKYEEAVGEGIMSEEVGALVREAEEMLRRGKFVDALAKSLESGDQIHLIRESMDTIRIELSSVKEQVDRLRKVGIDTRECDHMMDRAQSHMVKQDFVKAKEALQKCSVMAVAIFEHSINDVMKQNKELIARARSMGLPTKPCEDLMEVAKTSFTEKLWDFAYQQGQACRVMCIEVISKKIENLASDAKSRLEPLRASGASVRSVEDLIEQAKDAVGRGDASEAFQILMEADQRILGIEDSHRKFIDISIAAESAVEVLRRIGVSTGEAERLLALADLEREKDYDSAIEFVAEALDSAKATIESFVPEITGDVSSSGLQEGSPGEITIKLKNTGNVMAREITVELSGQVQVVDLPAPGSLRPGAEIALKAKVVPDITGEIPIRVNIACRRHFDGAPQTFEFDASVRAFKPGAPFKVSRAEGLAKCAYCQGKIKQGFDVVNCRCGNVLHLACAKRTGSCPVCGQKYSF